jgi:hypothetical protein
MIDLTNALETFGLPIMFLLLMIYLFIKFTDQHKVERNELRKDIKDSTDKFYESSKETTSVIRELSNIINSIHRKK